MTTSCWFLVMNILAAIFKSSNHFRTIPSLKQFCSYTSDICRWVSTGFTPLALKKLIVYHQRDFETNEAFWSHTKNSKNCGGGNWKRYLQKNMPRTSLELRLNSISTSICSVRCCFCKKVKTNYVVFLPK